MIITRKIEVYVHEEDKEKNEIHKRTIYDWSYWCRKAANLIVSHKFAQQNFKDFMYLQEDVRERCMVMDEKTGKTKVKFNVSDILKKEPGLSEQNTTYRLIASMLEGKVPSDIYSCLNNSISKTFKENVSDINKGECALRSYKKNIPIPFSAKSIRNLRIEYVEVTNTETGKKHIVPRCYFTLFKIPFACVLGADRSNNAVILDRIIKQLLFDKSEGKEGENTNYKISGSSIAFQKVDDRATGKKKQKLFLYLCIDIPQQEVKLNPEKKMFCYLGFAHPLVCNYEVKAKNVFDSGVKWFVIGTAEEFVYRRLQIQWALRRCQINSRWSKGGKGRKRKLQATDRFREKERNFVQTKLHYYSHELIKKAIENKCGTIVLVDQESREDQDGGEDKKDKPEMKEQFVLRNWSYSGLQTMIEYKAKKCGIKVELPSKKKKDVEEKE